ncbi:MAG TPA: hydroxymethylglutaryl-CoA lyase, partial [Anaerolineae bacterium]|nr:hydroxymethylglutaryl-CoA lyase [Anaerolineae bacterium]
STAWVCPFEGVIPASATLALAEEIWAEGIDELSVADTIGYAGPNDVGHLMKELGRRLDMSRLAVHLHDTQAMGLVNTAAAIHAGVRIVDSSIAGLGGCPFAPGAAGNLATEDLVFLAHKMGLDTGIDFAKLMAVSAEVEEMIGRKAGGRVKDWWACHRKLV